MRLTQIAVSGAPLNYLEHRLEISSAHWVREASGPQASRLDASLDQRFDHGPRSLIADHLLKLRGAIGAERPNLDELDIRVADQRRRDRVERRQRLERDRRGLALEANRLEQLDVGVGDDHPSRRVVRRRVAGRRCRRGIRRVVAAGDQNEDGEALHANWCTMIPRFAATTSARNFRRRSRFFSGSVRSLFVGSRRPAKPHASCSSATSITSARIRATSAGEKYRPDDRAPSSSAANGRPPPAMNPSGCAAGWLPSATWSSRQLNPRSSVCGWTCCEGRELTSSYAGSDESLDTARSASLIENNVQFSKLL